MEFFLSYFMPIVFCSISLGPVHLSPSEDQRPKCLAHINNKVAASSLAVILTNLFISVTHVSFLLSKLN
jgi:hypothetical protein